MGPPDPDRRSRVGGRLGGAAPSEDAEEYELEFLDSDGEVVRTETAITSPSFA